MAGYTQANPERVNRLVLYATLWKPKEAPPAASQKLGAYRTVTRQAAFDRWVRGVPEDKRQGLIPSGWFDAWADATFATDPQGAPEPAGAARAERGGGRRRAPLLGRRAALGPGQDHGAGPDGPGRVGPGHPALHVPAVFPQLTNAPWKRYTIIGEGTHTIIMEKNRQQLFDVVQAFLEEEPGR